MHYRTQTILVSLFNFISFFVFSIILLDNELVKDVLFPISLSLVLLHSVDLHYLINCSNWIGCWIFLVGNMCLGMFLDKLSLDLFQNFWESYMTIYSQCINCIPLCPLRTFCWFIICEQGFSQDPSSILKHRQAPLPVSWGCNTLILQEFLKWTKFIILACQGELDPHR